MTLRANCAILQVKLLHPDCREVGSEGKESAFGQASAFPSTPHPQLPASKIKQGILSISLASLLDWRRKWQPTPVLMPGKPHGRRSLVGYSPRGLEESNRTEQLHFHFSLSCTGEGNGNPLQCSCLENPRDGAAWWAVVYGVAQSRTRLKRLSSSSSSSKGD